MDTKKVELTEESLDEVTGAGVIGDVWNNVRPVVVDLAQATVESALSKTDAGKLLVDVVKTMNK